MITMPLRRLLEWRKWLFFCTLTLGFLISCDNDQPEPVDNLTVDRFEPLAALPGDTITIYGKGFDKEAVRNVVQFSSTKTVTEIPLAKIVSSSETEMQAVVPPFTESGLVKVAVGPFSTLSTAPFLLSPSISVVEPESAKPGEQVTIGGQNFTSDTSALVLFVGNVRIDSIFGASNSQIAFPLPFNVPPGATTIKLGIKIQEDTVFAPVVPFVVIDADNPNLISIDPVEGTPGTEVTLFGANFNPDETTVTFGGVVIGLAEFGSITPEQITLNVPLSLTPSTVSVTVTTKKTNGQQATTAPLSFTVLELVEIPTFYWSYCERLFGDPGGVQRIIAGIKTSLPAPLINNHTSKGITLSTDKTALYILGSSGDEGVLFRAATSTFDKSTSLTSSNVNFPGDITFRDSKLYFTKATDASGIWTYDILKPNTAPTKLYDLQISSGFANTPAPTRAANIKVSGSFLYWTESFHGEGKTVIVRADLSNPADGPDIIFSNDTHSGKLTAVLAIAIDGNNIYIVNSPHDTDYSGIVTGTSTIFRGNLSNPSTALEELHKGNVGKITDIEFYDGMLYYMNYTEDDTGGIFKISPTPGSSPVAVVEGIAHGAYFEIERE